MTLGIDMVDIARLRAALGRSPRLEERLFTKAERRYCASKPDPVMHFAGTLAAKEAVIKAMRLGRLVEWAGRIEIGRDDSGAPTAMVTLDADGEPVEVEVSISHERDLAVAVAQ
ncbi:MAG: 4'-phosphopantetheinyl transferase superfamily protein [Actinobacteria bacterium]|nr:4'-phosphopantetheinyl transferase superfamily protein [Actinomycetota bacterium]